MNKTATLINIISISSDLDYFESGTDEPYNSSDHFVEYCRLKRRDENECLRIHRGRNLNRVDMDLLRTAYQMTPFEDIVKISIIILTKKIQFFNDLVIELFDEVAPVIEVVVGKRIPAWLTYAIRKMIALKNKAFNK